jgi:hypothetical protein
MVNLALSMPSGTGPTESAFWHVVSTGGVVVASGTTDTSDTNAGLPIQCLVPAGSGDVVHLTVADSSGVVCKGESSPFNVIDAQTSTVTVPLSCVSLDLTSVDVTVDEPAAPGDTCPRVITWKLSSLETSASGGSVDVSLSAWDGDAGDALSFTWSATAGTFDHDTGPSVHYICSQRGVEVLNVSVSDNHAPTPCVLNVTLPPITCI